jgi:hypothetical protein
LPADHRRKDRFRILAPGRINKPIVAKAQFQVHATFDPATDEATDGAAGVRSAPIVRAVVVTLTTKVDAVVELNGSLTGTEQLAPVGAPVQLNEAVPVIPAPPMASV